MTGGLSVRVRVAAIVFIAAVYLHNSVPYLTMMPRINLDEPWLMERAYQVLTNGVPAQPMYGLTHAYLLQVGYPYLLAAWMSVFGVGLLEARWLGVVLGGGILLLVAFLGRRLLSETAGICAALFLAADSNFLGSVRNARTDIPSVFFGAAALALYASARTGTRRWPYAASGVAATAAMLCHGNALWVPVVIAVWLLADWGRRTLTSPAVYAFAAGLGLSMAPYAVLLLAKRDEVQRQVAAFVADRVPGSGLSFWLHQAGREVERYKAWYFGLVTNSVPNPLLWAFQAATVAGLLVLAVTAARGGRSITSRQGARLVLALAFTAALVLAALVNNKVPAYMPNLLVGFSLAAGAAVVAASDVVARPFARVDRHRWAGAAVALFVVAYGTASAAYYEKWYASARKSELVPYESTTATLRLLVPPGQKDVYGSPHFWPPFATDHDIRYFSYGVELSKIRELSGKRDVYLLVDESQWLPDLATPGNEGRRHAWGAFIEQHCALDAMALGTAYGTVALYRCALDGRPDAGVPRLIGGATEYRVTAALDDLGPAALAAWPRYADPRRTAAQRPDVSLSSAGLRIAGDGWPGVVDQHPASIGAAYLVRVSASGTRPGDLLYLGTWQQPQVLSLSGASASGMATPLPHEPWFPGDRAFIATAPRVQIALYSEAAQTDFVVHSFQLFQLVAATGTPR